MFEVDGQIAEFVDFLVGKSSPTPAKNLPDFPPSGNSRLKGKSIILSAIPHACYMVRIDKKAGLLVQELSRQPAKL
ncbi:MAG: hypothetical protein SFY92_09355 [Verrucomicrobiae bacterium]|nr:hypothetical protein [Verrucomicrobiae bacterium]